MTLGALIDELRSLPQDRLVVGFGSPYSHRGYYSDLSFEPVESTQSVAQLLALAQSCLGRTFQGYKGGDYIMDAATPLWLSQYGDADQMRIMGLDISSEVVSPVLMEEED